MWLVFDLDGVVCNFAKRAAKVLYKKTGSVWDCVMAHLVTNLLLGIYIVNFDAWHLW